MRRPTVCFQCATLHDDVPLVHSGVTVRIGQYSALLVFGVLPFLPAHRLPFAQGVGEESQPGLLWLILLGVALLISFAAIYSIRRLRAAGSAGREQLYVTLGSIADAVITTDTQDRITFMNPAAERLTGWTLPEARGQELTVVFRIVSGVTHQPVENPVAQVVRSGAATGLPDHIFLLARDGREIPIADSCAPIRDTEDKIHGVVLVFRDVTAQRQAEQQNQAFNSQMLAQHNAELEAERAYWRAAIEGIADEVWMCDAQGNMSLMNLPAVTQMGLAEFKDKTIEAVLDEVEILNPDGQVRPAQQAPLLRSLTGKIVHGEEIMRHRQTGRKRYRQFSAAPIRDVKGTITGAIAIVRDVTNERQVEQALQDSEARYRFMVDTIPQIVWTATPDGSQDFANLRWYEFNGLKQGSTPPDAWRVITHPDDVEMTDKTWAHALQTGEPYSILHRIRRFDGEYRWTLTRALPQRDREGRIVRWFGTGTDITDLRRAEEALRAAHEQTVEILESISDAFYALDHEWRFTYINRKAEELWARRREDLLGKNIWDVFQLDSETTAYREMHRAFEERLPLHFETHSTYLKSWVEVNVYPSSSGLSVYFRDITERKQTEERLRWVASFPELNPQPILEVDWSGQVHYRNPASQRLFPELEATGLYHPFLSFSPSEIAALRAQDSQPLTRDVYAAGRWFQQSLTYMSEVQRVRIYALDISLRKRAEERTARLQAITERFSEALIPAEVARILLEQGLTVLGAAAGSVVLLTEDRAGLEMVDAVGYAPEVIRTWRRFPLDDAPALIAEVVRQGQAQWFETLEDYLVQYPQAANTPNLEPGARAALPLTVEGRTIGGIGLSFTHPQAFSEDERHFMLTLAQQCAQALERALLYEAEQTARAEAEREKQRFRVLAGAGALLAASLDYETTLRNLEGVLLPTFADGYTVDLLDNKGEESLRRVAIGATDPSVREALAELTGRFPLDAKGDFLRKALRLGHANVVPEIAPDVYEKSAQDAEQAALFQKIGTTSSMNLPLIVRGKVIGVLSVAMMESGRHYNAEDVPFGEELARRIAQAIDNARLYQEAREAERQNAEHATRLSVLADVSRAFAEADRDLKRLFDTITECLATHIGEACALRMVSEDGEWMDTVSLFHPDPAVRQLMYELAAERRRTDPGLFKMTVETGKTIRQPVLTEEQFRASTPPHVHPHFDRVGARSVIVSPLQVGDQVIGILTLSRMTPDKPYTEEDEHLVQDLASRAALAIENAQLYARAQLNAETLRQQVAERTVELQAALVKAQSADQLKTAMLSTVSHEMRTPLSSIVGFSNLILTRKLEPTKVQEFASAINVEARRLASLVNDFLDLQRLEAGREVFRFVNLDLAPLVQDVVSKQMLGDDGKYQITLELMSVPPVYADADRIRQVLVNLLSNAVKFSPGGGIITVSLRETDQQVIVSVRDQGLGLPQEELSHLFERFQRGQAAERLRIPGTGLGLALCRSILKAHQGHIWAESAGVGEGAIVSFALPVVPPANHANGAAASSSGSAG